MASHGVRTRHKLHVVAIKVFQCLYSQSGGGGYVTEEVVEGEI